LPCGLGARNTLRLEAALSLYGHEISDSINVFEAGLDRFCKLEKGVPGIGSAHQGQAAGTGAQAGGLEVVERGIARDGYRVLDLSGNAIGYVTSGSPAPFLKKKIALAYVPRAFCGAGTEVAVEIRNNPVKVQVVPLPFYRKPKRASSQS